MQALGADIGGSKIQAAPIDVTAGKLLAERLKLETPHPSTPKAVAAVVAKLEPGVIGLAAFRATDPRRLFSFPGGGR